ncbi:MAG: hypothetical protein ACRD3B_01935 [Candidatus Sulfotelmatobacter sp.]
MAFVCALVGVACVARAQEIDLAVGGGTLWSPKNPTASVGFLPPPLKGGTYPSFSAEYIKENHWGFVAEGAFRYHYAIYNDYHTYRPIIYDVNGLYTAPLAKKTRADFMAGVGGETLIFYAPDFGCGIPTGGCQTFTTSTHFLVHSGIGVRYSVWRGIFVRPEAHWYFIPNNFQFHSDNLFRVGVSAGYTFGPR